jgi:hypothetical protein
LAIEMSASSVNERLLTLPRSPKRRVHLWVHWKTIIRKMT